MNKIEKQKMVCGVLNAFADEHKEGLGEPMIKELQSIRDSLLEISQGHYKNRDSVAVARVERRAAYDKLKQAITECRKTLELVEVRDKKVVVIPHVSKKIFSTRQIKELAANYLKAIESAGQDPMLQEMYNKLKGLVDEYALVCGTTTQLVYSAQNARMDHGRQLVEIGMKIGALRRYIGSHVPVSGRVELEKRIAAAVPRDRKHTEGSSKEESAKAQNVTGIPSVAQPVAQSGA